LPTGKIEHETIQGRADVGGVPTAETLGTLARKILSTSRHAESRELARVVLRLLAR
jgi:predicted aminopeptidase